MSRDLLNINVFGENTYFNDNVTFFKNVNIGGNLEVEGKFLVKDEATFEEDVTFKKDVVIEGRLDLNFLLVKTRLDVGIGGTALNIDVRTENVGIFTATPQQKFQFNSEDDKTFVITDEGRVGIGKTNPEFGIVGLNTAAQGELKLDIDGSISIARNIYDSVTFAGKNGYFLARDRIGLRWLPQIADTDGVMPLSVVLWGGNGNFPPPGYEICDGSNGNPNLASVTDLNGTVFRYIIKVV